MKTLSIIPSTIKGRVSIPPSKSQTLRALLFAALAQGRSVIRSPLRSPDSVAMAAACRAMGARVEESDGYLVDGVGTAPRFSEGALIDVGNSGITLRFIAAIAALGSSSVTLTGDSSIRSQRPMGTLLAALGQLGVHCRSEGGYAPLTLRGPLQPGIAQLDGADSQPVSALLIAGACAPGTVEIVLERKGEWPWVLLTLDWFDRLKIAYEIKGDRLSVKGRQHIAPFDYTVPPDMSSAAFPLAAALMTGGAVTLENFDLDELQGDKLFFTHLERMGGEIRHDKEKRELSSCARSLQGGTIDINDCIDALPIAAVVATAAQGRTEIINGAVARTKESDRIAAMARELRKMGAQIEERDDGLVVHRSKLKGAALDSCGDHRIAMALAVAALAAEGRSTIADAGCIEKSFPGFVEQMQQAGASITVEEGR